MFKQIIIEPRFTFKKEEKLKSRKLIEALFKKGSSFSLRPLRVLYFFVDNNRAPLQAGFAVSTKNFKKAVHRNRVKRMLREVYRLQKNPLTATLQKGERFMAAFFIYTGKELTAYDELAVTMQSALQKLNTIVDEAIAAGA